jgi:hypothetical protein
MPAHDRRAGHVMRAELVSSRLPGGFRRLFILGGRAEEGVRMASRNPSISAPSAADHTGTPQRGTGSGGPLERVTVNLTARSSRALDQVVQLTGDSKTDSLNRAIQVYAYIEEILEAGGSVHVRETADSEHERLKFF